MKTNTTTAAKLLEVSRQLGLSLPEVMLRRERELNETPPEVVYEKLRVAYGIMRQVPCCTCTASCCSCDRRC